MSDPEIVPEKWLVFSNLEDAHAYVFTIDNYDKVAGQTIAIADGGKISRYKAIGDGTSIIKLESESEVLSEFYKDELIKELDSIFVKLEPHNTHQTVNGPVEINNNLNVGSNEQPLSEYSNCFLCGTNLKTQASDTIVLGRNATATQKNTFVWNCTEENYIAKNGEGTFNLKTSKGIENIFINNISLLDIVSGMIAEELKEVEEVEEVS